MSKPRLKMIMNPNADMGNAWKFAADLRHLVEAVGDVQWSGTVYPTHAKELAKQAGDEGFDIVVAMGGDGTAHEVVNGLMEIPAEKRPKFAIVPLGSGNDYAANLGISKDAAEAITTIRDGYSKKVDLFAIEDEGGRQEYVDNTANIGFGGSVTIFSHTIPLLRGFVMYFVAVLQTIFSNFTNYQVEIKTDEKEWQDDVLMIALNNGPREGGGFITGPDAILDDGILNFCIVHKVTRLMMFRLIPEFMKGTQERFKPVYMGTFKQMEIKSDKPLVLHTDGEVYAGFSHEVHYLKIDLLPDALEVIVPKPAS
ncbi:MAG: diacylglycerol kinase family protein [Chloroflexota bacterium]